MTPETAANRVTASDAERLRARGHCRPADLEPDAAEGLRCLLGPKNPNRDLWAALLAEGVRR